MISSRQLSWIEQWVTTTKFPGSNLADRILVSMVLWTQSGFFEIFSGFAHFLNIILPTIFRFQSSLPYNYLRIIQWLRKNRLADTQACFIHLVGDQQEGVLLVLGVSAKEQNEWKVADSYPEDRSKPINKKNESCRRI